MVINISPTEVGVNEDTFYAESFASSPIVLGRNVSFVLTNVYNFSNSSSYVVDGSGFNGRIGIGLFDEEFNYVCSLDEEQIDGLKTMYGFLEIEFSAEMEQSLFDEPGVYKIAPYVIADNSLSPTRVRTSNGENDCIVITVSDDDIVTDGDGETMSPISFFVESFESMSIPEYWSQKKVLGTAEWGVRSVISASNKSLAAADGRSYAALEYSSDVLNMNRNSAVTKLITNYVDLSADSVYSLDLMVRARFNKKNSDVFLTLYFEEYGEWVCLEHLNVLNDTEWQKCSISLPGCGKTRFAFEGNVPSGGALFLDYISLAAQDDFTDIPDRNEVCGITSVHSVNGVEIPVMGSLAETLVDCPKGVYVVKYKNSEVKVYMHY